MPISTTSFTANNRTYSSPAQPVAVICIDGCADEYISESIAKGYMPRLEVMLKKGYRGMVRGALPSFTNVNNSAIVTGMPPSVTGICGNFFLNPETNQEVMMNSPEFRRCETLLTAAADAGTVGSNARSRLNNTKFDPIFQRFKELSGISCSDLRKKIAAEKIPALPVSKVDGGPMCLAWHVRAECNQVCGRKCEHVEYASTEYTDLLTWCDANFKRE